MLADSLEASCTELTGEPINEMDITPDAGPTPAATMISAPDCAAVASAIAATELRTEPVQCNFQPLLQQGAPALCGAGTTTKTVYKEDFEDGLTGWEKDVRDRLPRWRQHPLGGRLQRAGRTRRWRRSRGRRRRPGACTEARR